MVQNQSTGNHAEVTNITATSIVNNRFLNRGTAFTNEQRRQLGILGQIPSAVETLEEQIERVWHQLCHEKTPINRYLHLVSIECSNITLFYAVIRAHLKELLPIIYTPTVGEACQKFSNLYVQERGLYINAFYQGNFGNVLKGFARRNIEIIVITDGSRILGLGDLGVNGIGISIGKSSLYVAAGGIKPSRTLPVVLDVGTNNEQLRKNPLYLGSRQKRCSGEQFYALLDEFMEAVKKTWPGAVVQFEDFSNNHCFDILERYQKKYCCFNDDIQGTGSVIAAGFMNAVKLSGKKIEDHRVVVLGAGSAAVGVVNYIAKLSARLNHMSVEQVLSTFYLVDTKGLVTTTRGDTLASHKVQLARRDVSAEDSKRLKTLEDVVDFVKPTALIGLGTIASAFNEGIIRKMTANTARPIIFPLSNPTSKSEVIPDDAYRWTDGTAIIASGSPFPESVIHGRALRPSQGNNLYVFPGVGLGCALCRPRFIPDEVLIAASACLNTLTSEEHLLKGQLYPPVEEIQNISAQIATDVILEAQRLGIDGNKTLPRERTALLEAVRKNQWVPCYSERLLDDVDSIF